MGNHPLPFLRREAVEGWDGIGGEMVWARKGQAAGGRLRGTETKTVNPGKAKLIVQANMKVKEYSAEIVNALYDSLIKGNATNAKLLFDLADGRINCEDPVVMSQLCSYAESLTLEKQVEAEALVEKEPSEEAS